MNSIRKRLSDRRGSSMILSMVFFMIAFFVGSTVLASATANGGRLARLKENRQNFLMQRSAAYVFRDMLSEGENLKLKLTRIENTHTHVGVGPTDITVTHSESLEAVYDGEPNDLQEALFEAIIRSYADSTGGAVTPDITVEGVPRDVSSLTAKSGTLSFTVDGNTVEGVYSIEMNPDGSKPGKVCIDLGQMTVQCSLFVPKPKETVHEEGENKWRQVQMDIRFNGPIIVKGGAE